MMHAWASYYAAEGVLSACGSVQNSAWRISDTADVMFNIDNSPEQNGLWSFRKILCFFYYYILALCLDSCYHSTGLDGQISSKLLSPEMKWTLAVKTEQSKVELHILGEMGSVGIWLETKTVSEFYFVTVKKQPWRKSGTCLFVCTIIEVLLVFFDASVAQKSMGHLLCKTHMHQSRVLFLKNIFQRSFHPILLNPSFTLSYVCRRSGQSGCDCRVTALIPTSLVIVPSVGALHGRRFIKIEFI